MTSFNLFFFCFLSNLLPAQSPGIESLNSVFDEQNPVFSPDGKSLYFTIANHPQNKGGKRDPGDIWISYYENEVWSAPIHAGSTLNDNAYNSVAGFSPDGNTIYLLSHYDKNDVRAKTMGISTAEKNGSGWTTPKNISIPHFTNKTYTHGTLSSDNSVFIYSAEGYGSYGVEDIFVCLRKNDGSWAAPKNLGRMINTPYQELSPSVSQDGKTIYFSSNGRGGQGSFDVFYATRLDDTWTNWSEPKMVSNGVNTSGRELFFRLVPQLGICIYTSTINSDGYGDIKTFKPDTAINNTPPPVVVMQEPVASVSDEPEVVDKAMIRLYGKVSDTKSMEVVNARLLFMGASDPVGVSSTETGYKVSVPRSEKYKVKIEAPGYISKIEEVNMSTLADQDPAELSFSLSHAEEGTVVNLKSVLFERATTNLLPDSYQELDLVVSFLQENPTINIELTGHTDNRGVAKDNVKLSQERVDKVKEYLVTQGIDESRVSGKGYGGARPIASNKDEETRMLNRRVEFVIKKL